MSHPLRAALSSDRTRVIMRQGSWAQKIPADNLHVWLKLYTGLRDREKGRYAIFYAQSVAELERIHALIKSAGGETKNG